MRAPRIRTDRLRGTHVKVAAILDQPMTVAEIAQRLGTSYEAIASTVAGMRNRREVVALKAKPGKPNRYKLTQVAA